MEDLIPLLFPQDDIVDPFGSGRREGGNEGFYHTLVELRRLLDENEILLGILRILIIGGISKQDALPETGARTLRM